MKSIRRRAMLRRAHVHVGASRPSLSLRRPAALQTRVASASARRPTLPALSGDVTPVRGYSKAIKRRLEEKRSAVREEKERALEEEPVDVKVEMKPPAPWREEKWGEVRLLVLHPVTESAKYSHADYLLHEAVGLAEACGWKVRSPRVTPHEGTRSTARWRACAGLARGAAWLLATAEWVRHQRVTDGGGRCWRRRRCRCTR